VLCPDSAPSDRNPAEAFRFPLASSKLKFGIRGSDNREQINPKADFLILPKTTFHQQRRNRQFDLFRILFATLVLLGHAAEITDGNRSRELFNRLTRSGMSFGEVGVTGFFLLSGFLIVQSWQNDPEFWNFIRKRALRIVPGYLVAALLSTLVVGLLAPTAPGFFRHLDKYFALHLLVLDLPKTPPVFPGLYYEGVNGSLWTIPYEYRCYLLVALFGICALLRRPWAWLGTTIFLLFAFSDKVIENALSWQHYWTFVGYPPNVFRLTSTFFVGGCFYLFRSWIKFKPLYAAICGAVLVLVVIFTPTRLEIPLILFGGYLLFYVAQMPMPFLTRLKKLPDISYGIYLYGWPVESLLVL
jgi:peptidoglycan/LPS O-acetylase OafA/YrhL